MTPENAMFQKEHSVAGRGTCQWNPLFRKSVHFLRPAGADFPPFQLRNDPAWYFATKLVYLYTPMTSHQAPSSEGPSRLRKKGVSVKLPCRWSQEHDDVRP